MDNKKLPTETNLPENYWKDKTFELVEEIKKRDELILYMCDSLHKDAILINEHEINNWVAMAKELLEGV